MTRMIVASMILGFGLATVGCSERQIRREYDRVVGRDRGDRVDINRASHRQLERLPGIDADAAERIIANRPYPNREALVDRGVLGPRAYERIEEYVYAGGQRRGRDDDRRYRDDDRWDDDRRYRDDR